MELTGEQQAVLDGSRGDYLAKCMRWLVEWGEVMGAKRLIKVDNTHALLPVPNLMAQGASKETMDRYMADLVEACSHGTHPGCTCTVHAAFVTLDDVDVPENDPEQVQMQKDLAVLAADAGFIPTFTCAPYLVGNVPLKDEILAWTESSAVVYANSILGARTTRHGTESAIAASLLGLVPEFGVLLDENRKGTLRIEVTAELEDPPDWGCAGLFCGKSSGSGDSGVQWHTTALSGRGQATVCGAGDFGWGDDVSYRGCYARGTYSGCGFSGGCSRGLFDV